MKTNYNMAYIVGISFVSALGGYLFGFDFAVITGGLPFLVKEFSLTAGSEGATTASLAIGAILGCVVAGSIADKFGRKPGLLIAALIFTISSLIMGVAPKLSVFILGRFLAGVGVGMASMLSPLYIAEIAPEKFRGRLVALNQLTIVLGILITHIINYSLRNIGPDAWRWMFGLGAAPSLLFFIGVLFLPESPRWFIQQNKIAPALKILNKIGGKEFANSTQNNIQKTVSGEHRVKFSILFKKINLTVVLLGVGLAVFQQWCGINVVFNYTARIFSSIGADQNEQFLQAVFIGLVNLIFTIVAMFMVDKIGRKPLMLFGAGGLAILYLIIAFVLKIKSSNLLSPFILMAIATYATTLAPVTWILISEIFPNKIRGRAVSVATMALWLAYAILVFTFPVVSKKMGEFVPFFAYAIICMAGFIFIKTKLTETKGKTLEEVENELIK
jgi:sugar porter (SP) family MFS transporter